MNNNFKVFCFFPTIFNGVVAASLWGSLHPKFYLGHEEIIHTLTSTISVVSLILLIGLCLGRIRLHDAVFFILTQAAILIVAFASIYADYGLVSDGHLHDVTFGEGLYFSVTTWTSGAHGDFTAPPGLYFTDAAEAIFGSLYEGLFIAVVAGMLMRQPE